MNLTRAVRALMLAAVLLFLAVVLTIALTALANPVSALVVLAVAVLAYLGWRVGRRRVRRGTVIEIDLDHGVVEQPPSTPFVRATAGGAVVLRDVVDSLLRASGDPRVAGVVSRLGNGRIGMAHAQEIRDAVTLFRAAGKKTIAFSEDFGEGSLATADYYLATAFEEIHLQPVGGVSAQGLVARTPFLGALFEKIRVTPDIEHRREYKTARYLFTEKEFVPPHEEATKAVLEDHLGQVVSGIAQGRGLAADRVRMLVDQAPFTGREALDAGLIDYLSHREAAYAAAGYTEKALLDQAHYLKRAGRPHRKGQRIALVYGTGAITRGRSRFDPIERGTSFGADDVAQALRDARSDPRVKAIVFRVDSPGGSAVASEVVRHEVARASEDGKPVVVSMGNVAASGGYFVSTHADRIVAQPGTITGSIGVVAGKLARGAAWEQLGVNWRDVHLGANATFGVPDHPFTDSERERLATSIDAVYEDFKQRVAEGRDMSPDRVEAAAKGRIWTGAQARELGLVDELGGMTVALDLAKELAGIARDQPVDLRIFPRTRPIPMMRRGESSEPIRELVEGVFTGFDRLTGRAPEPVIELRMPFEWRW